MYHVQVESVILLRPLAARAAICKISATPREERKARADQPSNQHSAKLTPDLSVQKLACAHRAHISGE